MKDWSPEFINLLLEADSYRDFIRLFFHRDPDIKKPKSLTFGEFSRRSGFASRAYLNDVIAGRRRLTPGAIDKVALGLRIGPIWGKYLKCLAALEEPQFRLSGKDQEHYQTKRIQLKNQILRGRSVRKISQLYTETPRVFLRSDFPEIYASLGELGVGETFEGILRKSRLPSENLKAALPELESIGLIKYDPSTQRYVPLSVGLEAYGLKKSVFFKNSYHRSLEKVRQRFDKQTSSDQALFMTQSFSVKATQLSALREQLSEVIEAFAAQAEDAQGNCVAEICLGFTHNM